MTEPTADVLVVGAGIVGAACALACARRGLRVAVVDRAPPGGGATAACMGHVVVMDDSDAQFALTRLSRDCWDGLAAELPPTAEREVRGTLWIAADEAELRAVHTKHACYRDRGVGAEVLDAAALRDAEPALAPGLCGGLLVPGDSVVYPMTVVDWLLARAAERGARLAIGSGVAAVTGGTSAAVTTTDGTRIEAGAVVVAAGVDSLALLPRPLPHVTMRPRKGHLLITERYPGLCRHQLIELGYLHSAHSQQDFAVAFNLQPRATGQLLLGSSRQFDARSPAVEPRIVAAMIAAARRYVPCIDTLRAVRTWTGFRAATADSLPLIGPVGGAPGVWLATGHEGLGITTSLGTAELIAAALAGTAPPIDPRPYLPDRTVEAHG